MNWRTKIDTPWCVKGNVHSDYMGNGDISCGGHRFLALNYPNLFEPIEDKSEWQKLADWISNFCFSGEAEIATAERIAQSLIDAGVDVSAITKGK